LHAVWRANKILYELSTAAAREKLDGLEALGCIEMGAGEEVIPERDGGEGGTAGIRPTLVDEVDAATAGLGGM
jgi:hypothetical protein